MASIFYIAYPGVLVFCFSLVEDVITAAAAAATAATLTAVVAVASAAIYCFYCMKELFKGVGVSLVSPNAALCIGEGRRTSQ